ncbi:gem-associated protein 7-like [Ischnura elegans]|uniref:gem-associated protein 7-like n=1 Tax=Ischnura elegans TaxID=197161 RepID=UPI001ED88867|nr:gem-associated protein 7-like [Ischnura elegans]
MVSKKNVNSVDNEEQEARSFLRERYLRAMSAFVGKKCEFWMHESTAVDGVFKGCDLHGDHILVSELNTHLGVIPQTLLRTNDIISFSVKNVAVE